MWLDFLLRITVAGILGAVIGLDREIRAKEAGFRTHFLVSLGSALIMIVSQYGFQQIMTMEKVAFDPSRVAAQVVSGIGFIGAGTIIIQKQFVRGLTTAAGLWAAAGIGLAVGSGMYILGIGATILTLIGLEGLGYLFKSIGFRSMRLVYTTTKKDKLTDIMEYIHLSGYHLGSYEVTRENFENTGFYRASVTLKAKMNMDEHKLIHYIQNVQDVVLEKIE